MRYCVIPANNLSSGEGVCFFHQLSNALGQHPVLAQLSNLTWCCENRFNTSLDTCNNCNCGC